MNYWLFKSEPSAWSWDDQVKEGKMGAEWDGVRNHQAGNNMKAMKIGDMGFFYHSVNEKRIMGTIEVCKLWYLDPTDPKGKFGMVDVRAIEPLAIPVTLAEVKADERLTHLALVTNSRLSVQPVDTNSWKIICRMGGITF